LIHLRWPNIKDSPNAASLLEARELLPLALKDRQQRRMEWIARCELFLGVVCGEPIGNLSSVVENKFAVLLCCFLALVENAAPLEQSASDDLRSLRFSRHD